MIHDQVNAKLFVRLEPVAGMESHKRAALRRLRELDENGSIADHEVYTWGKEIRPTGPLEKTPYCRTLLEHIDELQQWIDEEGVVNCGFDRRDVDSRMVDERYDVITLPAICLAVYEGETLVDVYPRCDEGDLQTVVDGLAALERRRVAPDG